MNNKLLLVTLGEIRRLQWAQERNLWTTAIRALAQTTVKSNLQILSVSFTLTAEPSMKSYLVSTPPPPPIFVFNKEVLCQD